MRTLDDPTGLCGSCARVKVTGNRRGSVFYLCTRSREDPRYPRYPSIPVLRCAGYEPSGGAPRQPGQEEDDG